MIADSPAPGRGHVVARARATAAAWLERGAIERYGRSDHQTVLGHGDPNLANFLWDAWPDPAYRL